MNYSEKISISIEAIKGENSMDDFWSWYNTRLAKNAFDITEIPLRDVSNWNYNDESVSHSSGKFFKVYGIEVETDFYGKRKWDQPIISQPEIGILGFIVREIKGILHFLVQAKMEPGNINILQISPSVQATKSNYTRVHGGNSTPFIENFLFKKDESVVYDQLQSEQGSRFLKKRNRNMILDLTNVDFPDSIPDDFFWLTLGQLKALLNVDNIINMDSRTVLSGLPNYTVGNTSYKKNIYSDSLRADDEKSFRPLSYLFSWIANLKSNFEIKANLKPLIEMKGWVTSDEKISSSGDRCFDVIGVKIGASNREVKSWSQPILASKHVLLNGIVMQKLGGVPHLLFQAAFEPGNFDGVELAPTVQSSLLEFDHDPSNPNLSFAGYFDKDFSDKEVLYDSLQSEEGGRFYHDQNRYSIIHLKENTIDKIPENYMWITLNQAKKLILINNIFNVESRSLLSCMI
ncbi:dNDP-4-keto-6-deoxy-glucose-2,3- dehydratase [Leptospira kobayashii]|uniref:DNDP-4-keto-6-deoxy-glucose-2,3- dehydratase n=1 Tax=Leptospira kobayashii TaxID=1917830 RepID=A0ABN6KDU5_9LEPT|nr:NDP-hexose 2,3-dehydratase family protein [Leptospira kobayashii]BDA79190.1 dNDP-4-keto-6-deoxy-glucose-2,3- dehydratase [Leptospira kobayashii]